MKSFVIIFYTLLFATALFAQSNFDASTAVWKPKFNETAGHGVSVNGSSITIDPDNMALPTAYKAYWGIGNHNFNLYFHIKADQPIAGEDYPKISIIVNDQDQEVCFESGYRNGMVKGVKDGRYFGAEFNGYASLFSASWGWLADATVPYNDNIHSPTLFSDGEQLEFNLTDGAYNEAYCILRKTSPITGQLELYRDPSYTDPIDTLRSINLYQQNIGRNSMDAVDAWRDWCNEVTQTWDVGFVEVFSTGDGCKATIDQMWGEIVPATPSVTGKSSEWNEEIDYERGFVLYDSINGNWSIHPELETFGYNYIHSFPVGYNTFELGYTMKRGPQGRFPAVTVCVTSLEPDEQAGQPLISENGMGFGDSPGQASWIGVQHTGSKFNFYGRMYEEPDNPYNPHPRPLYGYHTVDLSGSSWDAVYVILRRVTPNYLTFGIYADSLYADPIGELEFNLIGRDKGSTFTPTFGLSRMGDEVYQSAWYRYGGGSYYNIRNIVNSADTHKAFVSDEIRDAVQQRYGEYMDQLNFKSLMLTFDIMGGGDDGSIENLFARELAPTGKEYQEWAGPTFVENEQPVKKPVSFNLSQNWPNPFNAGTTIEYYLADNIHTSVKIFDVLGREIITLVEGFENEGAHRIHWDGRNNRAQPVASGVYLCQIKVGDLKSTKKMVLMK